MKKIFYILSLAILASCSTNHENYYLNNFSVTDNLQEKTTTELVFKNLIYAKLLTNDEAITQFGENADNYSIVFLQIENISEDTSYFSFTNSIIENKQNDKIKNLTDLNKIIKVKKINLNDEKTYMNPFKKSKMEKNNFSYNIKQKTLTDFALQPNEKQTGFLIFDKLKKPTNITLQISSGLSIYTTRSQIIKLDY